MSGSPLWDRSGEMCGWSPSSPSSSYQANRSASSRASSPPTLTPILSLRRRSRAFTGGLWGSALAGGRLPVPTAAALLRRAGASSGMARCLADGHIPSEILLGPPKIPTRMYGNENLLRAPTSPAIIPGSQGTRPPSILTPACGCHQPGQIHRGPRWERIQSGTMACSSCTSYGVHRNCKRKYIASTIRK
ncbi:hypothetical protein PIB30_065767 [Stylosanthes scabra]|uniref:Uncharacterized protein n=1 Tax=Stylosanthes scabra TaxID=79078 RepID=A0ABU6ZKX6_9FABA|nr:hypothetical protein [Stylosanthes scabra]